MPSPSALVFPGQGSQRVGMLEQVPHNDDLDRLYDAAEALSGLALCAVASDGPAEKLADTRYAQPLLYLADWAWGVRLVESGVEPMAVAGHSLGEISALAVAGVFSVEAGLELVVERSKLMASAARQSEGSMSAVLGMEAVDIRQALAGIEDVWVANDNAPGQIVISGKAAAVAAATEVLTEAGARKVVPLSVAGAFHSPLMIEAKEKFSDIVMAADFRDPWLPVYQNTDPTASRDAQEIRRRLVEQIIEPVQWTQVMRNMASDGVELLIECGPGNVLTGLAKRVEGIRGVSAESLGVQATVQEVLS